MGNSERLNTPAAPPGWDLVLNTVGANELVNQVLEGVTNRHTLRSYKPNLLRFIKWLMKRQKRHSGLDAAAVRAYIRQAARSGRSQSHVIQCLTVIRLFARWAVGQRLLEPLEWEAIFAVQAEGVQERVARPKLTPEQARKVLNAPNLRTRAGLRDRALLALVAFAALSPLEVSLLRVDQLRQRGGHWYLSGVRGKGERERDVALPDPVKGAIDAWAGAAGIRSGALIRALDKHSRVTEGEIGSQTVTNVVARYAREAGVKASTRDLAGTLAAKGSSRTGRDGQG